MITSLKASNFMPLDHIEMEFPQNGIIQIDGRVKDELFADNNGAGKTTIRNLIRWVLFGDTDRGTADSVVNTTEGRDCFGTVTLRLPDGRFLTVERYRKHRQHKNAVYARLDEQDIAATNATDLQEKLNALIGLTAKTFRQTVEFDGSITLANMSDGDAKLLFEKLIGIDVTDRLIKAKEYIKTVDEKLRLAREAELTCSAKLSESTRRLQEDIQRRDAFAQTETARIAQVNERIQSLKQHLGLKEAEISEHEVRLQSYSDESLKEATSLLEEARQALNGDLRNREAKVAEYNDLQNKLRALESQPPATHCPSCGKPYDSADVALAAHKEQLQRLSAEAVEKYGEIPDITALQSAYDNANNVHKQRHAEHEDWANLLNNLSTLQFQVESTQKDIQLLEREAEARENPFISVVQKTETEVQTLNYHLPSYQNANQQWVDYKKAVQLVIEMYGNQGLRSFIIDEMLPWLNGKLAYFLSILTSGQIQAEFATTTSTGRERFHIKVKRRLGGTTYESLSKGERGRLDLAIVLTLVERVRLTRYCPLIVFDELFDGLDVTGVERVLTLLRQVSEQVLVLIISHNPHVRQLCDQVYTLVKRQGRSRLEE